MKSAKKVILVPTYNERDNISSLLGSLISLYPEAEIWVIDDSSPDGTGDIVRGVASKNGQVKLVTRTGKTGLGDAYKHALRLIQGQADIDSILTMDADGSHDPRAAGSLFQALNEADLAVGSRYVKGAGIEGWDRKRLALSWGGNLYVRLIARFPVKDATAGFVAFRRSALDRINLDRISSAGYSYQIEFKSAMLEAGATFVEVPIIFYERKLGASKVSGNIVVEGVLTPLHLLFDKVRRTRFKAYCAAALITLVALFSFYKLSESPSVWYDEGVYFQLASHVSVGEPSGLQTAPGRIEQVPEMSVGYPLIYPLALIMNIFGRDILTARSFMALNIILLVILIYALARRSFSGGAALFVLALLALFPPLYGNGKSVLGEVPGLVYLAGALFTLHLSLSRGHKGTWLFLSAIFTGLAAVTKPIFILALPAFVLAVAIGWRRNELSLKKAASWCLIVAVPFVVWAVTQLRVGDSFLDVLGYYSNPQPGGNMILTAASNLKHLFSDLGLMYLVVVMTVWVAAIVIRIRSKKMIGTVEIAAFAFASLIVLAYLRTAGYYRYLFPAQVVSIIYFPASVGIVSVFLRSRWKLSVLFQMTLIPLGVLVLFVMGGYQLMFHSWVADYYGSHKTQYWEDHFANSSPKNAMFYDVPEVAMFTRDADHYQYLNLAPAAGIEVGKENIPLMEKGIFDRLYMRTTTFEDLKGKLSVYHPVETAYKYTVLEKNR